MKMLEALENYLRQRAPQGIALAYSGGVDSTLLLAVLGKMRQKEAFPLAALTMQTVLQNETEIAESKIMAERFRVRQKIFHFNPFSLSAVRNNRTDRCYQCKKAIFCRFKAFAEKEGLACLIDGTNADDLTVYRPGRKALRELGVISPLAELGISKAQIRQLSARMGLPTAAKPAAPCLATRFEYNTKLDNSQILRVAEGEKIIKEMFPDAANVRLRVQGNLARIELPKEHITQAAAQAEVLAKKLKAKGFEFVTLDLEGFRSGCFDKGMKGL